MFRKPLPLFVSAAFFLALNPLSAQITLTGSGNPVIGTSMTVHSADTTGFNPGASGANVTWDFSGLTSQGTGTINVVATTNGNFPNSNITLDDPSNTNDIYMDYSGTAQSWYGTDGLAGTVIYTDPQDWLRYPMTYQDSFNDTYDGTVTNPTNQTFDRSGTTTVTVDGYGTLILPWGTVNNVVRVKTEMNYGDELSGTPFFDYEEIRYWWFDATTGFPVLSNVTLNNIAGGVPISTVITVSYLDQNSVGINQDLADQIGLKIFPNPTSDQTQVTFDLDQTSAVQMTLHDLTGREVQVINPQRLTPGQYTQQLNVSHLNSGVYLLKIKVGEKTTTRKISVN